MHQSIRNEENSHQTQVCEVIIFLLYLLYIKWKGILDVKDNNQLIYCIINMLVVFNLISNHLIDLVYS